MFQQDMIKGDLP